MPIRQAVVTSKEGMGRLLKQNTAGYETATGIYTPSAFIIICFCSIYLFYVIFIAGLTQPSANDWVGKARTIFLATFIT